VITLVDFRDRFGDLFAYVSGLRGPFGDLLFTLADVYNIGLDGWKRFGGLVDRNS